MTVWAPGIRAEKRTGAKAPTQNPAYRLASPLFFSSMPRNVEIKARVARPARLLDAVIAIADRGPTVFAQDDTFFACERGRLKLRAFSEREGQLIFYERPDTGAPKLSAYVIAPTSDPNALREALARAVGVVGRVKKTRTLFFVGATRIHLDDVEDLGHFVELEVVLDDDQSLEDGSAIARDLMTRLGIADGDLVTHAYVDLLGAV